MDSRYEDLDPTTGEPLDGASEMTKKARTPSSKNTPAARLEREWMTLFPGMKRFPSAPLHRGIKTWAASVTMGTDDAISFIGYFRQVVKPWVLGKNKGRVVINMQSAYSFLMNESKLIEYKAEKRCAEFIKEYKNGLPGAAARGVRVGMSIEED